MFLSLPHSLLALVICLLETRALADSPSPSPTAHFGNVGDYVASGLGINNGSTTQTSIETPPTAPTGSGQEYASSCASALVTWSKSSLDWQWNNAIISTSTFSSGFTETLEKPGSTKVTSVITLCDDYPRVVGHTSVSRGKKYTSTVAWTNTITESTPNHAYPTPPPCSIQPSDCKILSKSYEKSLSSALSKFGFADGQGPLCTTAPSSSYSYSYSVNTRGQTCDNCMIAASTARVMFWPVTTAAGGDLCNKTGSTITASPTGPPNSFVTEGITITSPTVAVSLGYMSRVDGCGTTIDHTIIPVHPDQVSSVRGFRALFSHHRFNFADLNYFCMSTNTTNATIAEGKGDSCYQQVPADAYFGGLNNAVVLDQAPFRNLSKAQMTIWDDYQPQLLPPQTMTDAITSLWGDDCIIHPDGVWDPPIALTPEASLVVPTYPGGPATTESSDPEATPASPINSYGAQPPRQTGIKKPTPPGGETTSAKQHFTALPETGGYGGSGSELGDGGSAPSNGDNSGSNGGEGNNAGGSDGANSQGGGSSQGDSGSNGGSNDGSGSGSNGGSNDNASGSGNNGGSHDGSDSGDNAGQTGAGGATRINVHTTIITVGSKTLQCTQDSNGAWIIPDVSTTHTASPGGTAVEIDAATLTAGANGLVNANAQSNKQTTLITIGNKILQCTQDSNGAWIIPDASTTHTASAGGTAVAIDAATLTAGADGLVNANTRNTVLTIGNKALTGSQDANGAWVVAEASTTHTLSQGGSAVVVDGVTFTAASSGLVKAHASGSGDSSSGGSAEESGTGTQRTGATQSPNRAQSTSATGSDGAAAATNTDSSSGAEAMRWSPAVLLTLVLLSMYICTL